MSETAPTSTVLSAAAAKQCGDAPRLALRGISKRYASVLANDRIDLEVAAGEIHAVLGENGAGKSTLMKIVYGVTQPDAGRIEWEGRPVAIRSPAMARRLGVGMVFQHFSLFETLTVAENIDLAQDHRPAGRRAGRQDPEVSERYGLPIDPQRLVHGMSVGERQRVEIVRCLLQSPRLLIMDEPTSVLTPQAVRALFETLRRLAHEGVSILYISHKLDEIRELCDAATVLRNGRVSGTAVPRLESNASLARLMVGSDVKECTLASRSPGAVQLELTDLSLTSEDPFGTALQHVNLQVRAGEIVGIAGVSGNGQKELAAAVSGEILVHPRGAVRLCGQDVARLRPMRASAAGAALRARGTPRTRRGTGHEPGGQQRAYRRRCRAGMARSAAAPGGPPVRACDDAQFGVKCDGELALAESLSGGNLQKFIVGREIRLAPKVMLVAQPTWGVDIGASLLIRQALIDLRDAGIAVLVISEELEELYAICDRLAVLAGGRLSPTVATAELPAETLGVWMTGAFAQAGAFEQAGA